MSTEKPFSETLKALLYFSKRHSGSYTIEAMRTCLGPIYHNEMRLKDILIVMYNALDEMLGIPQFEVPKNRTIYLEIIMSPFDGTVPLGDKIITGPQLEDKFSVAEFYTKIITDMMHRFMLSKVDWCRDYIFPEETSEEQK